jgi:hypothetical protein
MTVNVDQAALAGVGVAGVIAISSADGPYEPFDSVTGIVLAVLLISFYRPQPPASNRQAWARAVPAAAVGSLVLCLIVSPLIEGIFAILSLKPGEARALGVSCALSVLWVVLFVLAVVLLPYTAMKPISPADGTGAVASPSPESL